MKIGTSQSLTNRAQSQRSAPKAESSLKAGTHSPSDDFEPSENNTDAPQTEYRTSRVMTLRFTSLGLLAAIPYVNLIGIPLGAAGAAVAAGVLSRNLPKPIQIGAKALATAAGAAGGIGLSMMAVAGSPIALAGLAAISTLSTAMIAAKRVNLERNGLSNHSVHR